MLDVGGKRRGTAFDLKELLRLWEKKKLIKLYKLRREEHNLFVDFCMTSALEFHLLNAKGRATVDAN